MSGVLGWIGRMGLLGLLTCAVAIGHVETGVAQGTAIPPWPIVYDGMVRLDGELVDRGSLTARVGDWTSGAVPVVEGRFVCADPCLIVGPPDFGYIGENVTFHLEGYSGTADYSFFFERMESPRRESIELSFGRGGGWMTTRSAIVALGGTAFALMALSFVLYRILLRRGDGQM